MSSGYAIFFSGTIIAAVLLMVMTHFWFRIFGRDNEPARRELISWALRGLATPLLFVLSWNIGVFAGWLDGVVPLLPGVIINSRQVVDPGPLVAGGAGLMLIVITSYWTAFGLVRLLPEIPREEFTRDDLKFWVILYGIFVLPPAALLAWWTGPAGFGLTAVLLCAPVLQIQGRQQLPPTVSYARAEARMKFGKYAEAEQEVIMQLERREDDYDGWLMMAQLYAENFHDLKQAEATIYDLCVQPNLTPFHISRAFNRLADWHLNLGNNPDAARRALREIVTRLAGSTFARNAEARLQQLPLDQEELAEQRAPKKIRLPSLSDGAVTAQPAARGSTRREDARRQLDRLHVRLELKPDDFGLLERRAVLQAEELGDGATAIAGIEALLKRPDRPAERVPVWLAHLATWQLKLRHDEPAARRLLNQILKDYPDTPHAYGASSQLWALEQAAFAAQQQAAPATPAPKIRVQLDESPG